MCATIHSNNLQHSVRNVMSIRYTKVSNHLMLLELWTKKYPNKGIFGFKSQPGYEYLINKNDHVHIERML